MLKQKHTKTKDSSRYLKSYHIDFKHFKHMPFQTSIRGTRTAAKVARITKHTVGSSNNSWLPGRCRCYKHRPQNIQRFQLGFNWQVQTFGTPFLMITDVWTSVFADWIWSLIFFLFFFFFKKKKKKKKHVLTTNPLLYSICGSQM